MWSYMALPPDPPTTYRVVQGTVPSRRVRLAVISEVPTINDNWKQDVRTPCFNGRQPLVCCSATAHVKEALSLHVELLWYMSEGTFWHLGKVCYAVFLHHLKSLILYVFLLRLLTHYTYPAISFDTFRRGFTLRSSEREASRRAAEQRCIHAIVRFVCRIF